MSNKFGRFIPRHGCHAKEEDTFRQRIDDHTPADQAFISRAKLVYISQTLRNFCAGGELIEFIEPELEALG